MQTFLPYPDFSESAKALDKKRCWKQVVEAKQIISVLSHLEECPNDKVPWGNHPAVKMWVGHVEALKHYHDTFLQWCEYEHKIKTTSNSKYLSDYTEELIVRIKNDENFFPWWLGDEDFHRAMRARLIQKDREYYLPKFPEDENYNDGVYLWPVMDGTKTFKII